jgi:formamidopyrimidine-DNA glycosylase
MVQQKTLLLLITRLKRAAMKDIISGEIRDFLAVHNAKKSQSPTGVPISTKVTGGRKTNYTNEQELYS